MIDPAQLLRPHLRTLKPYSSARDDYRGTEGVFLDANENPLGSITKENWNRYPDPYQQALKEKIGALKKIPAANIFLGNGSDEPIDLLFRAFCEPGIDEVIINPPTYGMYKVSADINNIAVKEVLLTKGYELDVEGIKAAMNDRAKLLFICSPNNPTGNNFDVEAIAELLKTFSGIVVIDEAYIDFTDRPGFLTQLAEYPNLVVLQTFSKAWGLAALRLGMAFASEAIVKILNSIKPPYNLSGLVQQTVLTALDNAASKERMVKEIIANRASLRQQLEGLERVVKVHPSDANFLLAEVKEARQLYLELIAQKVIVRDRSQVVLCDNALRITVGTEDENRKLVKVVSGQ